ncbi:unnamed protein product [Coregonus sp. 'balchen']|nr:unnamed protein product [Coregonus sp. 'balchen']
MRHIHVELTGGSKEELAPVELPSHEGDLSPPEAPSQGPDPGVMVGVGVSRHFGQEQLRLQKVYQLSIFSQLGGFSSSEPPRTSEAQPGQAQRTARPGVKRGLEEPKLSHKWPHLAGDTYRDGDALEGGVLCGPGPGPGVGVGMVVGQGQVFSCIMVDHRDSDGDLSPRSPPPAPLSPGHTPARRPAQHNHDRPVPDPWAPLSPKSPPMVEPHSPPGSRSPLPSTEPPSGGDAPACSLGDPGGSGEGCSSGSSSRQPNSCTDKDSYWALGAFDTPNPPGPPLGPTGSLSPRSLLTTVPQEPGEGRECGAEQESSPPHPSATASTNDLASLEKTPSTSGFRGVPSGPWQAKKKRISSSDTAESCSEDEGPSTSKRSRLALLAPGLGLASCRGTDAKAAPFWNHLLPNAQGRDHPKGTP